MLLIVNMSDLKKKSPAVHVVHPRLGVDARDDRMQAGVARDPHSTHTQPTSSKQRKASPYSSSERRVPALIPVLGSQQ